MNIRSDGLKLLIAAGTALLLGACTVGPDYVRPTPVTAIPESFKELNGWKIAQPKDGSIPERWWEIYGDPVLNSLEDQAATGNLSIVAAEARYRQARAAVQAARAGYFPAVTAGASATRSRRSSNAGSNGASTSDFQLPLDVTWELDLWGKIRRSVEASQAAASASSADRAAVALSIHAELASNYLQVRVLDVQKRLFDATATAYRKSLALTQNRYNAGVAAKSDVLQAETQLKSTEAQAIDLSVQRSQLEHAIALLTGKTPASFSLPDAEIVPSVPHIPAGLPSDILERRPDISSAERTIMAANAQIGIAKAAYYPTIRLGGSAGFESTALSSLFNWPSRFWSVGPVLSATLFDGGARAAQSNQVKAAYDVSVAEYRETVLTAFQEVEDNLAALRILEDELRVQDQAVQAARQVVVITTNQYQAGTVAYLNVLVAQTTALANERTAVTLLGRKLTASVLLVKALGGGWNQKEESKQDATNAPAIPHND